mmetsp:Transcript_57966/g.166204  ORF Transcript_57966/g.166204 Transcript_57966/m.166204 type:complete len:224 (-) Transcript_57966:363-1034(-)
MMLAKQSGANFQRPPVVLLCLLEPPHAIVHETDVAQALSDLEVQISSEELSPQFQSTKVISLSFLEAPQDIIARAQVTICLGGVQVSLAVQLQLYTNHLKSMLFGFRPRKGRAVHAHAVRTQIAPSIGDLGAVAPELGLHLLEQEDQRVLDGGHDGLVDPSEPHFFELPQDVVSVRILASVCVLQLDVRVCEPRFRQRLGRGHAQGFAALVRAQDLEQDPQPT